MIMDLLCCHRFPDWSVILVQPVTSRALTTHANRVRRAALNLGHDRSRIKGIIVSMLQRRRGRAQKTWLLCQSTSKEHAMFHVCTDKPIRGRSFLPPNRVRTAATSIQDGDDLRPTQAMKASNRPLFLSAAMRSSGLTAAVPAIS